MAHSYKQATVTKALPAAAGDTSTDPICVYEDGGEVCYGHEFVLSCPALVDADLAAAETMTYALEDCATSDGSYTTVYPAIAKQTGTAVTGGAAAQTVRFKVPSTVKQYVRITATTTTEAGDASDKSVTLTMYL